MSTGVLVAIVIVVVLAVIALAVARVQWAEVAERRARLAGERERYVEP